MTYLIRAYAKARWDEVSAICIREFPGAWNSYAQQENNALWIARNDTGALVGFCIATYIHLDKCVFLSRAWVAPEARGQGLQRRMIAVRERWAKEQWNAIGCYTYTLNHNKHSSNNLIKSRYVTWWPNAAFREKWAGSRDVIYWYKGFAK